MALPALLFLTALAVRALTGSLFPDPAFPDPLYYVNVARQIAAGEGFRVDYLWSFVEVGGRLPVEGVLPVPSNAHWMPLASIVQVPFIWLLGPTPTASGLPFWLAGAAVAPLTWWIGVDAGLTRFQAGAAAVLVIAPGGLVLYTAQPDNFALFMLTGSLALWLCARGLRGSRRAFAAGGLVVGLAFLSRTDGLLLGIPFALAFLIDLTRPRPARRVGWLTAGLCAAGFALIASPWLARQVAVFGSVSPSASNGRILWAASHDDIFSVTSETSPASLLARGIEPLIVDRAGGLGAALVLFAILPLVGALVPFLVTGLASRWRQVDFAPWSIYTAALLAATGSLFAIYVTHGFFIHSMVALVPHAYVLVIVGIESMASAVARRRKDWNPIRATRAMTLMLVGAVMVASVGATITTLRSWRHEHDQRAPILAALQEHAQPGDRVMTPDPGAYRYHGGWHGVPTPNDPLAIVEHAARIYQVRWMALERDHLVPALKPVLAGEIRPDWLSEPIVEARPSDDQGLPEAALYAVCVAPEDVRCT